MSKNLVDTFVKLSHYDELCPEFHRAEEDQEMSRCLVKLGIFPTDSRDSTGRDRFHQFHPEEISSLLYRKFILKNSYYFPFPVS